MLWPIKTPNCNPAARADISKEGKNVCKIDVNVSVKVTTNTLLLGQLYFICKLCRVVHYFHA